jgi:hypothetical protein
VKTVRTTRSSGSVTLPKVGNCAVTPVAVNSASSTTVTMFGPRPRPVRIERTSIPATVRSYASTSETSDTDDIADRFAPARELQAARSSCCLKDMSPLWHTRAKH